GPVRAPGRPASGSARPELHGRRPLPHRRGRPLPLRDDQARRLAVGQPPERLAAAAHSLLALRAGVHRAPRHADVLPRRPLARVRPDLPLDPRGEGPAPPDQQLRLGDDDAGLGARLPVRHRARRTDGDADGGRLMTLPLTPSQTVGPYFAIGLARRTENQLVPSGSEGAIVLEGHVMDADGAPVPDAMVEI